MDSLPEKSVLSQETELPETCALSIREKNRTSGNISKELPFQNRVPHVQLLIFWLVSIVLTYITPTKTSRDFQETQLQDDTFGLDLYRKSGQQDRELFTDKLYPCLFCSWRGKVRGNWFNSAPILGNRSCPLRRTCFGGWRQNYFEQHPKVLKVRGREISSCHPMEKEHYLTSKQLCNGTSKTWRNRTQASEEPGDR